MFASALGKTKAAAIGTFGSEGQRIVGSYLFNDSVQIMTSLDMNRIASLSYGETVCDEIFELFENTLSNPVEHSILCHQKALVLIRHLVIYGHERCVNMAWNMGRTISNLQSYNTAIASQQKNIFLQFKGGEVDKAFKIRELATDLNKLLQCQETIFLERMKHASSESIVPVGTNKEVGFSSDYATAAQFLNAQNQQKMVKPKHAFGHEVQFGGGAEKKVVSATHSLEEMMETARKAEAKQKNRYFDDRKQENKNMSKFSGYVAPSIGGGNDLLDSGSAGPSSHTDYSVVTSAPASSGPDLLDFGTEDSTVTTSVGQMDLLNMTGAPDTSSSASVDLLGGDGHMLNQLGNNNISSNSSGLSDLLSMPSSIAPMQSSTAPMNSSTSSSQEEQLKKQLEMQQKQIEMLQRQMQGGGSNSVGTTGVISHTIPSQNNVMMNNSSAVKCAFSAMDNLSLADDKKKSAFAAMDNLSLAVDKRPTSPRPGDVIHPPPMSAPPPPPPPSSSSIPDIGGGVSIGSTSSTFVPIGASTASSSSAARIDIMAPMGGGGGGGGGKAVLSSQVNFGSKSLGGSAMGTTTEGSSFGDSMGGAPGGGLNFGAPMGGSASALPPMPVSAPPPAPPTMLPPPPPEEEPTSDPLTPPTMAPPPPTTAAPPPPVEEETVAHIGADQIKSVDNNQINTAPQFTSDSTAFDNNEINAGSTPITMDPQMLQQQQQMMMMMMNNPQLQQQQMMMMNNPQLQQQMLQQQQMMMMMMANSNANNGGASMPPFMMNNPQQAMGGGNMMMMPPQMGGGNMMMMPPQMGGENSGMMNSNGQQQLDGQGSKK